jgi:GDP-L-fucose synthase
MTALEGKRIWIAGHRGMVGRALVRRLEGVPGVSLVVAERGELDLGDREATRQWVKAQRPDLAFIAAAKVGGILANDTLPVDFLEDNLRVELSTIRAAFDAGVEQLLFLGSSCIYPRLAPQPIREDSLLTAPLEPTNQWYAIAKIAGIALCDAFRKQYGACFISAMPTNLYGPGDSYDLASAHVLAAAIRKVHEAQAYGRDVVTVWGSGTPLREFMHVADAADALVFLMQHYDEAGPINVGSGDEISILGLHEAVREVVGWRGQFRFDPSKPDGMPRKLMDSTRLHDLGWQGHTDFRTGLADTYRSFLSEQEAVIP